MEVYWLNKAREKIRVQDMIDSHLLNVIHFIYKGRGYDECITVELGKALLEEADRRGLDVKLNRHSFMRIVSGRETYYKIHAGGRV